ncbi:MAG: hypothetical protein KDD11_04485 [Acidobacteria bacterium]|nr:hypothetical protein [Acidobacteriota bacterium]
MTVHRRPLLSRLRGSTRWAVAALAVFVLRLGMVMACAPGDLSESLAFVADADAAPTAAVVDHGEQDGDQAHATGHCLHCGCHLPAALPSPSLLAAVIETDSLLRGLVDAAPDVPPRRELRPPIA